MPFDMFVGGNTTLSFTTIVVAVVNSRTQALLVSLVSSFVNRMVFQYLISAIDAQ